MRPEMVVVLVLVVVVVLVLAVLALVVLAPPRATGDPPATDHD